MARRYRFNDIEIDLEGFRLLKGGHQLPVEPKALNLLIFLVDNRGRLVERQKLIDAVWRGAFVTDHVLNRAVGQLRKLLEDDPKQPRYIETVPTRGYRFIAEIEEQEEPGTSVAAIEPLASRRIWPRAATTLGLLLLGLGAGGYFYFHRSQKLTEKDFIVLSDFTNTTRDSVFDDTLRQGLSVQLEQSPFLSVVSDDQIQQTLKMMGQKPDVKLTAAIAHEICQRTGSTAVLEGSIAQIGTPYLLTVKAINCSNGETLASTEAQASDKSHVLDALGKTASDIRNKLGESLSTVQKFDKPLEQATTPSLEALEAFQQGPKTRNDRRFCRCNPILQAWRRTRPEFRTRLCLVGPRVRGCGRTRHGCPLQPKGIRTARPNQ